jgi:micrococcal nuclease
MPGKCFTLGLAAKPALPFIVSHFALFPFLLFATFLLFLFPSFVSAATVTAVIDGDTIRLDNGRTVRYLGVNTPEHGQPFYDEAKRFNERLVTGKPVRLETHGQERDRYGRELAYVFVEDVLINSQIVAEGWGHVFILQPLSKVNEWLPLQKNAQDQRKGIWRDGLRGPLKITTIHADAKGDDRRNPNGEYLRLCNVSDKPVALQGFALQDAAGHRFVFPSGTLVPGATALLVSGPGEHAVRHGQLVFYWGSGPIWNNDGDTASLFASNGELLDTFRVLGVISK